MRGENEYDPSIDMWWWSTLLVGLPDVRDLNFDGAEDFGLLAVFAYPQNVPYSYFFWNADKELFEYQFTAFGPGWLQIDDSEKALVELSNEGTEIYKKYFKFTPDGLLLREDASFDKSPVTIDGYVYLLGWKWTGWKPKLCQCYDVVGKCDSWGRSV